MAQRKINVNYTKAIVVCHGKSEKLIAEYLKSNLRINVEICSKDKGKHSIQITSLNNFLKNKVASNLNEIRKKYLVEYNNKTKKIDDFKIFTIMDTDDCTEKQKENYINGKMFKDYSLNEYIVPIYNINKLEYVIKESKIWYEEIKESKKAETYIKIFPPAKGKKIEEDAITLINERKQKFEKNKNTNLDLLFKYCIEHTRNFKHDDLKNC